MLTEFLILVEQLAHREGVELEPGWFKPALKVSLDVSETPSEQVNRFTDAIKWRQPIVAKTPPGPQDLPLLVHSTNDGWAIAEQWEAEGVLRVIRDGTPCVWVLADRELTFCKLAFPPKPAAKGYRKALQVFVDAFAERKRMVLDASVATIAINIIALMTSMYTMQVYDRVVPRGGFSTLWVLTAGVLVATVIDFLLRVARSIMLERESAFIDSQLSSYFFGRSQAVRLDARQGGIGSMAGQLRGYDQVRSLMSSASIYTVADLPFALLFIWVIYLLAGQIALVPAAAFVLSLAISILFAFLIRKQSDAVQVGAHRKNGLMVESLDAAETIKSSRGGWQILGRWNRLVDEVQESDYDLKKLSAIANAASTSLQQTAYVCLIAWGAVEIVNGNITTGTLIAASILNGRITGTLVTQLPGLILQASYARSALTALNSFLELPVDREPEQEFLRPEIIHNNLIFEGVEFAYPGAQAGFAASELKISPGERVAILGPVGSGKSTFLKIAAGLFPSNRGRVLLDGLDMGLIAEDRLRQHVGYLGQDFRVVNGTLREQLTMGISDPGDQAIMDASEKTGLRELIARHPKGLDLPITEGGRGLSGGQRMLTGLTRMLLAKPKLWLLDEPTASLDPETEQKLWSTLISALGPDDTLMFVTHKFQLLNMAQRVIVISQGKVVLDGPTAAVLEKLRLAPTPAAQKSLAQ